MKKITTLTGEQKAALKAHADKWIAQVLDPGPAPREMVERSIREHYRIAGLRADIPIIWVDSPWASALAVPIAARLLDEQVGEQVGEQVDEQVDEQVYEQVGAQVDEQVYEQVDEQVGAQVGAQVRAQVRAQWAPYWYCDLYSWWPAYVTALRDVLGVAITDQFTTIYEMICRSGFVQMCRDFVVVSDRHSSAVRRDAVGRLHSLSGPAIQWADGWGIWAVNGVRVERHVVEAPETITVAEIDGERNAEVRRVLIERYGLDRYITDAGAVLIHEDTDALGLPRRLLRREFADGAEPLLICEVTNSTPEPDGNRRKYHLGIHPECRPLLENDRFGEPQTLTCHNAVASTFGLRGEDYAPEVES